MRQTKDKEYKVPEYLKDFLYGFYYDSNNNYN